MEEIMVILGILALSEKIFVLFDAWVCFSPLKWRKGLITTISIYWGLVLGFVLGFILMSGTEEPALLLISMVLSAVLLPILVYKVPFVNRFIVGFIVANRLSFMITTEMMRSGNMPIIDAITAPLFVGIIAGTILMLWKQFSIGPYIIATSFIGASQAAPVISEMIGYLEAGVTGNIGLDPYDLLFSIFRIELTDSWTLIILILLMCVFFVFTYKRITSVIPSNTPLIVYEKERR